jgi:cytochrome c peroxidase
VLSASGHFSCQSCHNRRLGWGDALPTSFGHGRANGRRNAPGLFTAGYKSLLFWDGRSSSLEEQALGPLMDGSEMANGDAVGILERVNAADGYRAAFAAVTGEAVVSLDDITAALAAFQRTLERTTRFDRYLDGNARALTDTEIWGLHLFRTKAGCANCHNGPTLSDGRFHNLGLSFLNRTLEDLGRHGVTGVAQDAGRFLTPSLRHVASTGPYMHNGIFPTLDGLIRFYEGGGGRVRAEQKLTPERQALLDAVIKKSPQLERFELTPAERAALLAYLKAL